MEEGGRALARYPTLSMRPKGWGTQDVRPGAGSGCGGFFVGIVFQGGGVQAAEDALVAVLAGFWVVAGGDGGLAGDEVFCEVGEGLVPEGDLVLEGGDAGHAAGFFSEKGWVVSKANELHAFSGAELGEGYGSDALVLGVDGVEGELRGFRACGDPLPGCGFAGFVVDDDEALGGVIDTVYDEVKAEGAEVEVFDFEFGVADGEVCAFCFKVQPGGEEGVEALALDLKVGSGPDGLGMWTSFGEGG